MFTKKQKAFQLNALMGSGGGSPILRIWIYNDTHIWRDNQAGRNSFTVAKTQIEAAEPNYNFAWGGSDIMSRNSEAQHAAEIASILAQQVGVDLAKHYRFRGNSDCYESDGSGNGFGVWDQYIDVLGNYPADSGVITANRPYPFDYADEYIQSWKVGNNYFIQISDYNNGPTTEGGKGTTPTDNSYPIGSFRDADWLKLHELFFKNLDKNIFLMGHHPFKDTTWVSSFIDSVVTDPDPTISGGIANYLGFIGTDKGSDNEGTRKPYLLFGQSIDNPFISAFFHGHTHCKLRSVLGGKKNYRTCWGFFHQNTAVVSKFTYLAGFEPDPNSWFAIIQDNNLNLRNRVHYAPNSESVSANTWYAPNEQNITLKYPYVSSYPEPTISAPSNAPTGLTFTRVSTNKMYLAWTEPSGGAHGYLVIRRSGAAPTGSPTNDTAYRIGDTIGDGTVVFMGTNKRFWDFVLTSATTYHYKVIPFNGGGGVIKYGSSVATGNKATTQGNIYVWETFEDNVPNRYLNAFPMSNLDKAYFLHDDLRLKIHCDHSTNSTISTDAAPINVLRAPISVTVSPTIVCAIFDAQAVDFSAAGSNLLVRLGFYNQTQSPNPAKNMACYLVVGYAGELALRAETYRANALADRSSALTWDGSRASIKIVYNHTTVTATFYMWVSGSWSQLYQYVMPASGLAASRDFRMAIGFEDSTSLTNGKEVHIFGKYLTATNETTQTPADA